VNEIKTHRHDDTISPPFLIKTQSRPKSQSPDFGDKYV